MSTFSVFTEQMLSDANRIHTAQYMKHRSENGAALPIPATPEVFLESIEEYVQHDIDEPRAVDPGEQLDELAGYLHGYLEVMDDEVDLRAPGHFAFGIAGEVKAIESTLRTVNGDLELLEDYEFNGFLGDGEVERLAAARATKQYLTLLRREVQLNFLDAGYEELSQAIEIPVLEAL